MCAWAASQPMGLPLGVELVPAPLPLAPALGWDELGPPLGVGGPPGADVAGSGISGGGIL